MDEIKPTKIVKANTEHIGEGSHSNIPENIDSAKERVDYDPRLYADSPLVDKYKHYPLFRFFGLSDDEKMSDEINERVQLAYKWAHKKTSSDDPMKNMQALRQLELELGMPQWGMSRLDNLYRYINVDMQISDLESQQRNIYGFKWE